MSADTTTAPAKPRSWSRLGTWDVAVIVVAALVIVVAALSVEHFGTTRNLGFLILEITPILVLALPLTLIIITGEIDLSVASMVGLTSAAMGTMWNAGLPLETILWLTVLIGALLGAINGFFVTVLGLPSLAVTIGTLALFRGLAFVLLGDTAVADFPRSHTEWAIAGIGDGWLPNVTVPILVLVGLFTAVLHATTVGRSTYAIGANPVAAAFAGISVGKVKFWLYVLSGAVAGLVGVYWTLRFSSARADNANGLELTVVAAVLLGGVSIFGGKGTLPGVVGGVVLLAALQNALRLSGRSADELTVITGALLIFSVLAPNIISAVGARLTRRRRARAPVSQAPSLNRSEKGRTPS